MKIRLEMDVEDIGAQLLGLQQRLSRGSRRRGGWHRRPGGPGLASDI